MATTMKNPIWSIGIDSSTRSEKSEHNGQTCYLCSLRCKKAYDNELQKNLGKEHTYQNFYIFKETPDD